MINRRANLLFIFGLLTTGLLIYTTTRSETIIINQWIRKIDDGNILRFLQSTMDSVHIPDWIKFSLPDALWMLALILLILLIWDFKLHRQSIPWLIAAALTGLFFEIFQGFNFIKGTFDFTDLLLILAGALLPISFTMLKVRTCKTN